MSSNSTLRQKQIKQDTSSNKGGGLQNQRGHHIILTKYEACTWRLLSSFLKLRDANNFDKSLKSMYLKLANRLKCTIYLHSPEFIIIVQLY